MKNVVVGILYPGVEPFLEDYFGSIVNQSTKNFELYLFKNDFTSSLNEYLERFSLAGIKVKLLDVPLPTKSPLSARQFILNTLRAEFVRGEIENIIFTDSDDYFHEKRVELSLQALVSSDIVFNDLTPFTSETREFFPSLFSQRPFTKLAFKDMLNKNIVGYSHVAMKAKHLQKLPIIIPESLGGVTDWWFFSLLLAQGLEAVFIDGATTYYRQYSLNTAGLKGKFTLEQIEFGLEVKRRHYTVLLSYLSEDQKLLVEEELEKIKKLEEKFYFPQAKQDYLVKINEIASNKIFYWWEQIDLKYVN